MDFRIGSEMLNTLEAIQILETKKRFFTFWQEKGAALNMEFKIHIFGQIHIDSASYRTLGSDYLSKSFPCLSGPV